MQTKKASNPLDAKQMRIEVCGEVGVVGYLTFERTAPNPEDVASVVVIKPTAESMVSLEQLFASWEWEARRGRAGYPRYMQVLVDMPKRRTGPWVADLEFTNLDECMKRFPGRPLWDWILSLAGTCTAKGVTYHG